MAPTERFTKILQSVKAVFFCDYVYPDFVYGLGGNTLRDHAAVHSGENELIKTDITDFFPSINHEAVYKMWVESFSLPADVARILTRLTTFENSLKQGFATSSHIAAVVALPLTQALNTYCHENGVCFSQYVDDLNFSARSIEKREIFKELINLARASGLSVKKRKTLVVNNIPGKTITGVSVYGERVRASKVVRSKAATALKCIANDPNNEIIQKSVRGYQGYLNHLSKTDGKNYKSKVDSIINQAESKDNKITKSII